MKRSRIFALIMAIVWTILGIAAIVMVFRSSMTTAMNLLIVLLAIVAVVGNWLRYFQYR